MKRVVQIGFNKCGTRSLALFFEKSGHSAVHWRVPVTGDGNGPHAARIMDKNLKAGTKIFDGIEDFVFYSDLEYNGKGMDLQGFKHFKRIDTDYPDTVFLLNTRDRDAWVRSRLAHGKGNYVTRYMRTHNFATEAECIAYWENDWDAHLADVRAYFADRPANLIEFRIDTDDIDVVVDALPELNLQRDLWKHVGKTGARRAAAVKSAATGIPGRIGAGLAPSKSDKA